ncbi:MAG: nitronate monooxygenase [Anaerolineae bacterium]|nr:nitronate monooxygenase [Anaerolineae bacterium]
MELPTIIQGGMGVGISTWQLANAVSSQGYLGVVSGTGVGSLLIARLMQGDIGGDVRRALEHFPFQEPVKKILDKYYVAKGIAENEAHKVATMWTANPPQVLNELTVIANYVEVFLAKEGHDNPVGINLLEKVQLPNLASLYGAMLANVSVVLMGAGIPMQIPGVLDKFKNHEPASYQLDVDDTGKDDEFRIHFDPESVFPGITEKVQSLTRPLFLPIVSSVVLAKALIKRATGSIEGFVIEAPIAGGHNAPPRGGVELNENGEPIYGEKDEVDLERMKGLGLPFWLAGGFGSPEKLKEALSLGAAGIQVGTAFAFCDESGMVDWVKKAIIKKVLKEEAEVHTSPAASPTGFPFKVAKLEGTLSDREVYDARNRVCDLGFLRQPYKKENGELGYRCPAEPIDQYVSKGGKEEDTENRSCLCNNLFATAGFPMHRKDGSVEPGIVTTGDDLPNIVRLLKPGKLSYTAEDVLNYLTGKPPKADAAPA